MSKSDKAFELQEKIGKLIDKLDALGFEFMYFNGFNLVFQFCFYF